MKIVIPKVNREEHARRQKAKVLTAAVEALSVAQAAGKTGKELADAKAAVTAAHEAAKPKGQGNAPGQ